MRKVDGKKNQGDPVELKIFINVFIFLLFIWGLILPNVAYGVFKHNLVPNGGFEIWIPEEGRPAGWKVEAEGNSVVYMDSQERLSGRYSARLEIDQNNSVVSLATYFLHSDSGAAELEVWFKTTPGCTVRVILRNFRTGEKWDFDNHQWVYGWVPKYIPGDTSWQVFKANVEFEEPDEYRLSVGSGPGSENGIIWIDNISLYREMSPFAISTRIGTNIMMPSVSNIPFWEDSFQQQAFEELNLSSVRIPITYFQVIENYSPSYGYTYDWSRLDTTLSLIRNLNPNIEFIFSIAFPSWCRPPGLPMIEEISSDSTGGPYNYPEDEALAQFCQDLAQRALDKGWNVSVWLIHNEPGANLQDSEQLFPLLISNYNSAASAIKSVFPNAFVTMGFINSNPFYEAFINGCANYTNCLSIHKSGGITTPEKEVFPKADKWWWHYYSPDRRKYLLLGSKGNSRENIPIVIDEGSDIHPVETSELYHTKEECAYEALMFKFALFEKARNWHYIPFASYDSLGVKRPALFNIMTKEKYPVFWFLKFLTHHVAIGDSMIYEDETEDKSVAYYVWKHGVSDLYYLVVNRTPDSVAAKVNFISPTNYIWMYDFEYDGVDSLFRSFDHYIRDTVLIMNGYDVKALKIPDLRTDVKEPTPRKIGSCLVLAAGDCYYVNGTVGLPIEISIYDVQGRIVKNVEINRTNGPILLRLTGLTPGVYFSRIKGKLGVNKERVLIIK